MTAKPVIITVDDDTAVLAAIERDLKSRYAVEYQVIGATSGEEAIELIGTLATRETPVALLLVDQRMPQITGLDVLRHAVTVYPDAKKALLTAYADTDAAISAINEVGLDHYIMKPWDPPEELLYPILDDLLDDWHAGYRPLFDAIRVVGAPWSKEVHELKAFLARNQIPYRSVDLDDQERASRLMAEAGATPADLPLVLFPDSPPLMRPTPRQVAERVGLRSQASSPAYDLVVVGAGPSGLAAAVYGASEGLGTLLVEEQAPGGQAGQSSRIENYLGFPKGISGSDLARRAVTQATRFGAEILVPATVERIERKDPFRIVHLADGSTLTTKALLVTSGVSYRRLPADGLDELSGRGVYYGTSRTEAVQHRGEDVFVVGGGNSAGQAALFLTGFATSVTIVIRGQQLASSMSQYLIDSISTVDSITILPDTQVVGGQGTQRLEGLRLRTVSTGEERDVEAGAVFIFIGQKARTEWLADLVALDDRGFVLTGRDVTGLKGWNVDRDPLPFETSVPGVFAAGDVRHGSIQRVAGATGEGAAAVRFVHQHLAHL